MQRRQNTNQNANQCVLLPPPAPRNIAAGEITAAQAVRTACADLQQAVKQIDSVFASAVEDFKANNPQPMDR